MSSALSESMEKQERISPGKCGMTLLLSRLKQAFQQFVLPAPSLGIIPTSFLQLSPHYVHVGWEFKR